MSVEMSVEINGFEELMRALDRHDARTKHNAGLGLVAFGQEMKQIIREYYVPVRTDLVPKGSIRNYQPQHIRTITKLRAAMKRAGGGTLRASIQSSYYRERGDWLEVIISAGRPGTGAEKYAAVVHEKLTLRHMVGQAKYIETPLALNAARLADFLVTSIRFSGKLSDVNYDSTILLNPTDF